MTIKKRLEEFAEIRNFANTKQRKELIDNEVKLYLTDKYKDIKDFKNAYISYIKMYNKHKNEKN